MKVLVTITPRMYRESVALIFRTYRPDFDVMLSSAQELDGPAHAFRPHLLIRSDTDGADMDRLEGVLCWIEVLYSDSMGARVSSAGRVWEIEDMSTEDLLGIADETQDMIPAV